MTDSQIYPLTFEPAFRDYIWGGRNLETLFGRKLPPGIVAESWEISGHLSSPTAVEAGPLAGMMLPEVQGRLGDDLVGKRSRWAVDRHKFPLLVKLLDANRRLSVQVDDQLLDLVKITRRRADNQRVTHGFRNDDNLPLNLLEGVFRPRGRGLYDPLAP